MSFIIRPFFGVVVCSHESERSPSSRGAGETVNLCLIETKINAYAHASQCHTSVFPADFDCRIKVNANSIVQNANNNSFSNEESGKIAIKIEIVARKIFQEKVHSFSCSRLSFTQLGSILHFFVGHCSSSVTSGEKICTFLYDLRTFIGGNG